MLGKFLEIEHDRAALPYRTKRCLQTEFLEVFADHDECLRSSTSRSWLLSVPLEVFCLVVDYLDIATMRDLYRAMPCLRETICRIPALGTICLRREYKNLIEELFLVDTAQNFTFTEVAVALRSSECMLCKNSKGQAIFFSLLHCIRVCKTCVKHRQDFLPLKVQFASEIFGVDPLEEEEIPVAHFEFTPTDEQLDQGWGVTVPLSNLSLAPQWHYVTSLSSVARVALEDMDLISDPISWTEFIGGNVNLHMAENYCLLQQHSCCSARGCLLPQRFDLEPFTGMSVRVEALYAAMSLDWEEQELIAREMTVVPVPIMGSKKPGEAQSTVEDAVTDIHRFQISQMQGSSNAFFTPHPKSGLLPWETVSHRLPALLSLAASLWRHCIPARLRPAGSW